MKKIDGNEIIKNMEHLVNLVHKEWERSGMTEKRVPIDIHDMKAVGAELTSEIRKRHEESEAESLNFQQYMELSKESFILLRLAKKIKVAGDKTEHPDRIEAFMVEMDKEEYQLFSMLRKREHK